MRGTVRGSCKTKPCCICAIVRAVTGDNLTLQKGIIYDFALFLSSAN